MLFDLKGKRRRAVQGTYLTLAILMGAGLVLFGVGSSVNGGLGDLFKGGGGSSGSSVVQKQVDAANKKLAANPSDPAALKEAIVGHYRLATADSDQNTGQFGKTGKQQLTEAAAVWQRYVQVTPKPDPTVAAYMFNAFSEIGLNQPGQAAKAGEVVAESAPSAAAYVRIVQYASLAKDTRTADLAAAKALAITPSAQRGTVKQEIAQAKHPGTIPVQVTH